MLLEGIQLYQNIVRPYITECNLRKHYGIGYGLPIVVCSVGFGYFWFAENILIDALFDERYNYL
jgi:hypothetical protein